MHVYITPQCRKLLKEYKLEQHLSKLEEQLTIHALRKLFHPVGKYWRRSAGEFRIIGTSQYFDKEDVLCLVHVFRATAHDYYRFLDDPDAIEFDRALGKSRARGLLRNAPKNSRFRKKSLPSDMLPWFQPPGWGSALKAGDWVVYEAEEWLTSFRPREIQDQWSEFRQIILKILNGDERGTEIGALPGINIASEHGKFVVYSVISRQERSSDRSAGQLLFLLNAGVGEPSKETLLTQFRSTPFVLSEPMVAHTAADAPNLARYARRAYPGHILADGLAWLAIQREEEANLALSPEEEEILESLSGRFPEKATLPTFINGRAGSAKSTLLCYLFADYCYRKAKERLPEKLLYVTYNEKLVERAKENVSKLLQSHYRFLEAETSLNWIPSLEAFFRSFAQLLLGLLPDQLRADYSEETKQKQRMDFSRFKARYETAFGKKGLSAELSWYVIKTFIKGYDANEYMTPVGYNEVPRRERSVTSEMFQEVHDTAWRWYQNLMNEGFWDDQDLVREALRPGNVQESFAVIFCDEAQDLTRIELQLLMNLSVFHAFDLGSYPIRSLPYAFAGDPFQTLNPMGFKWSIVQSTFFQEVLLGLDPHGSLQLRMNPQFLNNNYRSSPGIVRASNLVLLWRHVLLNHADLEPQFPWRAEDGREPKRFIIGTNISQRELRNWIQDTMIIVPCEEGEESSFIVEDDVLSELFRGRASQEPPKNVLSAAAAKGLEFKRVVVYKFGEKCNDSIWNQPTDETDGTIENEYFFNKLYVAVSRAIQHLFIVDTSKGDKRLWSHAAHEDMANILQRSREPQAWLDSTQGIPQGNPEEGQSIREDDPVFNADQLRSRGIASRDTGLLRRAKQFYAGVGRTTESQGCEATALRIEGRFREASDLFEEIGEFIAASECLWEGSLWKELVSWSKRHPGVSEDYVSLARFWRSRREGNRGIIDFCQFLQRLSLGSDIVSRLGRQLSSSVIELMKRIRSIGEEGMNADQWLSAASALAKIEEGGFAKTTSTAALCFYRAGVYRRAVDFWEKAKDTETREYFRAKAFTHPARKLYWLERAESFEEILEQWQALGGLRAAADREWARAVEVAIEKTDRYEILVNEWKQFQSPETLSKTWLRMIGIALERAQQYWDAARIWTNYGDLDQALGCLKFVQIIDSEMFDLLEESRNKLAADGKWSEALWLVDRFPGAEFLNSAKKMQTRSDIVKRFAHSDEVPHGISEDARLELRDAIRSFESSPLSEWHQWISISDVGTALDRLGESSDSVDWFSKYLNSNDPDIRASSRKRWLALKKKEVEILERRGRMDMARSVSEEIAEEQSEWLQDVKRETRIQRDDFRLVGLPGAVVPTVDSDGFINIRLGQIDFRISEADKKISMTHSVTWNRIIVDFLNNLVSGDLQIGPNAIPLGDSTFAAASAGCSGNLFRSSNKCALTLQVDGYPSPVIVEWETQDSPMIEGT